MSDNDESPQVELIEQRNEIGDVMRQRERRVDARMIGVARSDPIGGNGAIACVRERANEIAVEKAPGRIPRKEQHGPRGAVAFVDIGHAPAVDR